MLKRVAVQLLLVLVATAALSFANRPTVAASLDCPAYPTNAHPYGDPGNRRLFSAGDSTADGYGSGWGDGFWLPSSKLAAEMRGDLDWHNVAQDGETLATMDATFSTQVAAPMASGTDAALPALVILQAGINDFAKLGSSPATVYSHWQSYASQVHAAGAKFYAVTTLHSTGVANATVDEYDDMIVASVCALEDGGGTACADRALDLRADPRLASPGTAPYWHDGTHPSANGYQAIAFDIQPMLTP